MFRAAHQLIDRPPVFEDPLAVRIIGEKAARELREGRNERASGESSGLRAFIAVRSRLAEDCLEEAMRRGVRQYMLLGAGLDTFAYRASGVGLRVFEVDHPATQAWKRERLRETGIPLPDRVIFAPVDFERETLGEGLARAGFDFSSPVMIAWLGVTPYLTQDAVMGTLSFIATLGRGSEVVFDYAEPATSHGPEERQRFEAMAARVAQSGEPFRSFFESDALIAHAKALGFSAVEDLDSATLNARYFQGRSDGLSLRGRGRILRARL